MVGYHPSNCPFCGASSENFMTAEQCSEKYEVRSEQVSKNVDRLNSHPALGLEHAAYKIDTGEGILWIDCPSTFDKDEEEMEQILFTHPHFLGASNLYRDQFSSQTWIHHSDSKSTFARGFKFDNAFENNFSLKGVEAFHIDGHTQGFTCYVFKNVLFICDYVFLKDDDMDFNPYGPREATERGAIQLREILDEFKIEWVGGVDYAIDYSKWRNNFESLLQKKKLL